MKTIAHILVASFILTAKSFAQGTILWNESVNGPLAPTSSSATPLGALTAGTNRMIGTVEAQPTQFGWTGTEDYFTFSVPASSSLTGIFIQVDNRVISWVGNVNFSSELGSKVNPANGELLVQMSIPVLPSGSYGMYMSFHEPPDTAVDLQWLTVGRFMAPMRDWGIVEAPNELQQFPTVSSYTLDFFVQSIPEPSVLWLLLGGLGCVGFRRRRKPGFR